MRPRVELATLLHVDAIDRRRRHSTRYIAGGQHTQTPSPLHQPPTSRRRQPRSTLHDDHDDHHRSIFHITRHRNISWSIFHTDSITLGLTDKESTGDLPRKSRSTLHLSLGYIFSIIVEKTLPTHSCLLRYDPTSVNLSYQSTSSSHHHHSQHQFKLCSVKWSYLGRGLIKQVRHIIVWVQAVSAVHATKSFVPYSLYIQPKINRITIIHPSGLYWNTC